MGRQAILFQRAATPIAAYDCLIGRASRARTIGAMLSRSDAQVVEAYAAECEAEARRIIEQPKALIAA
jgi:hypothetical protein